MTALKLLILGGSGEAADLARALDGDARYDVTLSLAGRTSEPVALPGTLLTGGFGGAEGLARVLGRGAFRSRHRRHPSLRRADEGECDRGREKSQERSSSRSAARLGFSARATAGSWSTSLEAAAAAIGEDPRRVFLTTGRMELAPFRSSAAAFLYCAQRRGALARGAAAACRADHRARTVQRR